MPHESDLSRPILVIGAPRSGTTLLAGLLSSHRQLVYADEPRLVWRWGNDSKSDMLQPLDARPEVVRHIRAAFGELVSSGQGSRLLEKTPANTVRLPFVNEVFPDAIYVHIIRDGYASILSSVRYWTQFGTGINQPALRERLIRRTREITPRQVPHYAMELIRRIAPSMSRQPPVWGPRIPGLAEMAYELSVLDAACLQWRTCVEQARAFGRNLEPERYIEVRLESLNLGTIRPLLRALDLPSYPEYWNTIRGRIDAERLKKQPIPGDEITLETIRMWIEPTIDWIESS